MHCFAEPEEDNHLFRIPGNAVKDATRKNDFTFLRWLRWRDAGLVAAITLLLEWTVGVYWYLQQQRVRMAMPESVSDWSETLWVSVLWGGLSVILPVYLYAMLLVATGCVVTRMAGEKWAPPRGPVIWFVVLSALFTLTVSHAAHFLLSRGEW